MARMRSWLFVPGDSTRKLDKAHGCGADVIIVDLEDAVLPQAKEIARGITRSWLTGLRTEPASDQVPVWVRINPVDTPLWRDDLAAVMPGRPDGIVVPKLTSPEQLNTVSGEIYGHEQRVGLRANATQLLALVSETPQSAANLAAYANPAISLPRVIGLTWGAEDLSATIGATRKRDGSGNWTDLFRMVRAQTLLAAHARGLAAIDTLYDDFRDLDGLKRTARAAYADGWTGMMAIHPDQVAVINQAFMPGHAELAHAYAIIAAFEENPGAGAVQLDGRMIDRPHLAAARALIERAM